METDTGIVTMVKKWALTKRAQYEAVYKLGTAKSDSLIVLKKIPNNLNYNRYGFSISKNVGNAVKRNYIRRTLKEIARWTLVKPGFDIVFIARRGASNVDFHQFKRSVLKLISRSDLSINENEMANPKTN